jgi:hypothetical protein
MKRTIEKLFRRYGTRMTLYTADKEETFQGFLHVVPSRSWQNTQRDMTVLGEDPGGQYVLILPAGIRAVPGDTVKVDICQYTLRRIEQILYQDTVLYQWGLCVKKGGD